MNNSKPVGHLKIDGFGDFRNDRDYATFDLTTSAFCNVSPSMTRDFFHVTVIDKGVAEGARGPIPKIHVSEILSFYLSRISSAYEFEGIWTVREACPTQYNPWIGPPKWLRLLNAGSLKVRSLEAKLLKARSLKNDLPGKDKLPGYIYFMQPVNGGLIKIGFSASPYDQLSQVQQQSPVPQTILAVMPGTFEIERRLHKKFAHLREHVRKHGEFRKQRGWFRPFPELLTYIEAGQKNQEWT